MIHAFGEFSDLYVDNLGLFSLSINLQGNQLTLFFNYKLSENSENVHYNFPKFKLTNRSKPQNIQFTLQRKHKHNFDQITAYILYIVKEDNHFQIPTIDVQNMILEWKFAENISNRGRSINRKISSL